MKKVLKFAVPLQGEWEREAAALPWQPHFHMEIPADAQLLAFRVQGNVLKLWALCDVIEKPEGDVVPAPAVSRRFKIYTTGEPIKAVIKQFVGTVFFRNEKLVLHLFELEEGVNDIIDGGRPY